MTRRTEEVFDFSSVKRTGDADDTTEPLSPDDLEDDDNDQDDVIKAKTPRTVAHNEEPRESPKTSPGVAPPANNPLQEAPRGKSTPPPGPVRIPPHNPISGLNEGLREEIFDAPPTPRSGQPLPVQPERKKPVSSRPPPPSAAPMTAGRPPPPPLKPQIMQKVEASPQTPRSVPPLKQTQEMDVRALQQPEPEPEKKPKPESKPAEGDGGNDGDGGNGGNDEHEPVSARFEQSEPPPTQPWWQRGLLAAIIIAACVLLFLAVGGRETMGDMLRSIAAFVTPAHTEPAAAAATPVSHAVDKSDLVPTKIAPDECITVPTEQDSPFKWNCDDGKWTTACNPFDDTKKVYVFCGCTREPK